MRGDVNGTDQFPITVKSLNKRGELWSRVTRGAVAYVRASMPADQRRNFSLDIVSLQAGFKGFGGSGNSPTYDAFAEKAASAGCQTNFSCVKNSSNALPSRAVVGLLFNNTTFCTGTLMNNLSGNFKPYVLTARHCGSSASINWDASSVLVAWNAVADCGQPLQNVYNPSTVTSSGATTRMISGTDIKGHTGDAWLIELDSPPPVGSHPYWAGFDATDTVPSSGVYNINNGSVLQQQYAADSNAPSKFGFGAYYLPNGVDNSYWNVMWTTSATQPGASGSGLVDVATNRVIGSLTGGVNPNNCPGDTNPPNDSFYRLALAWVGDGSSAASINSWLDPSMTGTLTMDGKIGPPAVEVTSVSTATAGQPFTVSWDSTDATSCTASGGATGDGWVTGPIASSGSVPVTESAGTTVFTVSCTNATGTKSEDASVDVLPASTSGGSGGGGASSGGSSGGGSMSLLTLLPLLLMGLWRQNGRWRASNGY